MSRVLKMMLLTWVCTFTLMYPIQPRYNGCVDTALADTVGRHVHPSGSEIVITVFLFSRLKPIKRH